jgi:hypothetical protein
MKNNWMAVWVIALGLMASAAASAAEPTLSARFDRERVFEGDSVVLRVELSNARLEVEPDFSALEKDFHVGQSGTNSSISIINGRKEFRTEWNVLLEPRRLGEIKVPALSIGPYQSQPLKLTVVARPQGSGAQGRDVFLEVEATPKNPYVQSQVLFVIRLYHAPSIMEGSLGEPTGVPAVVERLGDDTDYRTVIDGQNYRVIERRYAVFPEHSGQLVLPEIRFQGRVADRSQSGAGFNSLFSRGRLTSVKSDPVVLQVRPRPAQFDGANWLPAADFKIQELWPNGEPEFRVGEPVTRNLVTEAQGLLSAQLPEFQLAVPDGAKLYPDQPVSQSRSDGAWVTGRREDRFAIVPVRSGTLTLPEIRIAWWDTVKDRAAEAIIPAREFTVLPAADGQRLTVPLATVPAGEVLTATQSSTSPASGSDSLWRPLALAAIGLWLVTLMLYLRRLGAAPQDSPERPSKPRKADANPRMVSLKKACNDGDAPAAARALLSSLPGDPAIHNLGQLAGRLVDQELVQEIRDLDRTLYRQGGKWQGDRLWALARKGLTFEVQSVAPDQGVIPPLYRPH